MSIQILDPRTCSSWDELLLRTPGASFFHSSAWARVLSESYGYTPLYFTVIENGKLRALVPLMEVNSVLTGKRGVSLPFTDYCEPIIDEGMRLQDFLEHIVNYGKKRGWRYIELRGGKNLLGSATASEIYLGHTLDLSDSPEIILGSFRKGTKSAIKKAEKEKIEIKISSSEDAIIEFYKLNCITRKYHGLPPQPRSFFKAINQHILKRGLGSVILAFYQGGYIAGGVFFYLGNKAIYKYGASRREYQHLRATNLVVWNAMKYFLEKGCKDFCFGRTEPENEGLRIFKNGWGTVEHNLSYFRYDLREMNFVVNRSKTRTLASKNMLLNIIHRMPIPILNFAGSLLYRHMG